MTGSGLFTIVLAGALTAAPFAAAPAVVPSDAPGAAADADGRVIRDAVDLAAGERPDLVRKLAALGKEDLAALERAVGHVLDPTDEQLAASVAMLGDADPRARQRAAQRLRAVGEMARPSLVAELHASTPGPEARRQLVTLIRGAIPAYEGRGERKPEGADRLAVVLSSAYTGNWPDDAGRARFLDERFARLLADPHDRAGRLPFLVLSFDMVWDRLKERPPAERARYLLLRVSRHHVDHEVARVLTDIPAADLFGAARATYWPVEVAPPRRDGAYLWAVLAREVRSGVAERAIHVSIEGGDEPSAWGKWVHFEPYDAVQLGDGPPPLDVANSGWIRDVGYGRVTYDSLRSGVGSADIRTRDLINPRPPARK